MIGLYFIELIYNFYIIIINILKMKLSEICPQCSPVFWFSNLIQIIIATSTLLYTFSRLKGILTLNNYIVLLSTSSLIMIKFIVWTCVIKYGGLSNLKCNDEIPLTNDSNNNFLQLQKISRSICFEIIFLSINCIVYEVCLYNFKVYLDNLYHSWIEKLYVNIGVLDQDD